VLNLQREVHDEQYWSKPESAHNPDNAAHSALGEANGGERTFERDAFCTSRQSIGTNKLPKLTWGIGDERTPLFSQSRLQFFRQLLDRSSNKSLDDGRNQVGCGTDN
jgi:hypothetical protein